jgi:hypothetical protein
MSRIALASAALLAVLPSACARTPMHAGGPLPSSTMTCDAGPARWAVGNAATAEVIERVRVDSHSRIARVLRPGQMVTMEFSAERVGLRVDEANVVLDVTCG